ncbi:MAG: hypothetical protein KHW53_06280 [Veillonella sp.]|uniref:hypothetical protein n=1 Tax=Veillonella sp. TaxID=1926307 RepID=UPI00257FCA5B|nr:hypothetical protein [Veillonella sp.]MBS5756256.1 hypothetical protein [Veillonella sp.]
MKACRPKFDEITSFDEFKKYYWYRDELSQICKSLGLIKKTSIKNRRTQVETITLDTPLLECNFSFNTKFREYFSDLIGVSRFKFNADMATAWRKVKSEKNTSFTIGDLLKVYYGESDYAKYDRDSKNEKIYSNNLLTEYAYKLEAYRK